jgi:hypothetical protein
MAEIPMSGSGEGPGWETGQGYSTQRILCDRPHLPPRNGVIDRRTLLPRRAGKIPLAGPGCPGQGSRGLSLVDELVRRFYSGTSPRV